MERICLSRSGGTVGCRLETDLGRSYLNLRVIVIAPSIGVQPALAAAWATNDRHAMRSADLLWTMRLLNARIEPCWTGLPSTLKAIVKSLDLPSRPVVDTYAPYYHWSR